MINYFSQLNLPQQFEIDNQALYQNYLAAQLYLQKNEDQSQLQQSLADLNQAHFILKNHDTRAVHLLHLLGQKDGLEQSINDLDFLQNALELRESLDEATQEDIILNIKAEATDWIQSLAHEFALDYQSEDWIEARETVRKLKFMYRLLDDIARKQDALEDTLQQNFDDDLDELY